MENQNQAWEEFLELCIHADTSQRLKEIFNLFLTIEEKEALAARTLIIKALLEECLTQREIAEQFEVSISKITRGSNALKIISAPLKKFLLEHFFPKKP